MRYDIKAKSWQSVSVVGISEDLADSRYHDNYRQSVLGKILLFKLFYSGCIDENDHGNDKQKQTGRL